MAGSLGGVDLKLARASEHLEAIERMATLGQSFVIPRTERVSDRTYTFLLESLPGPSDDLAVVLGDFVFNLRSTLDQLVYQLHVRHFRGRVPAKVEKRSAFPVRLSEPKETSDSWPEIGSLGVRERTKIERLQPYRLDPLSPSFRLRDNSDQLHWRRTAVRDVAFLNNIDKHRRLNVMSVAMQGAVVDSDRSTVGQTFEEERRFGVAVDPTDWLVRRVYDTPPATPPVHPGLIVQVGLEDQNGMFPMVTPWMRMLRRVIGEVVDMFRPLF